jgi:hypothetical protein
MYYIFRNHSLDWDYGRIIDTPPKVHDWLVLAQIVVQWACSLLLYVSQHLAEFRSKSDTQIARFAHVVAYSPHDPRTNYEPNRRILSSGQIATALLVLHAIFAVASILIAGKPARYWDNLAFLFMIGFNTAVAMPIATILTVAACALQASRSSKFIATSKSSGNTSTNALSRKTLVLQMLTFLALAILWPFRFRMPSTLVRPGWEWLVYEWYPNVGWLCVNNAVIAVGQYGVLYVLAGGYASGNQRITGERQALLSS